MLLGHLAASLDIAFGQSRIGDGVQEDEQDCAQR